MGRKGRESIGYYTHFVTFNCDLNHAIDLQQATKPSPEPTLTQFLDAYI